MERWHAIKIGILALATLCSLPVAEARSPFDAAPIRYSTAEVDDPVFRLRRRLERGETQLAHDPKRGYLESLLRELKIPVSSQGLVFSKTSFQRSRITPQTPRAIYFRDDVYVGWVPGGDVIELSGVDPNLGAVFYRLDQRESERPSLKRSDESCLICHSSLSGRRIPNHVVRSVFVGRKGMPLTGTARYRTDHTSPFDQRWGGWYVTGRHGEQRHLGNLVFESSLDAQRGQHFGGANVDDLASRFDTTPYLSPHSDIVALMVLEHQTHMHNVMTAANYEVRRAFYKTSGSDAAKAGAWPVEVQRQIEASAEEVVRALLFIGEPKLTHPVSGTTKFVDDFLRKARQDADGRSLRDFDLKSRLFKHPCSYLIHSRSFDQLPGPLLDRVYARLWQAVGDREQDDRLGTLTTGDRRAIREILLATKTGLPKYWR